jgi:DNA polymerase I-like protein with 3'-5' exonuclease and polymerase domains
VAPIRELRSLLGKMRLIGLSVDEIEGRNRFLISPFKSATSRNQPSNTQSVFGPSVWLRHLIVPQPGTVLLYCDWSSQEYVIAGALSGDPLMLEDCAPGRDPYIRFGQHGELVPEGADKRSHPLIRDRLKIAALATLYGQTEVSLGPRLGIAVPEARRLLDLHARLYPTFWAWQRAYVRGCMVAGLAWTRLGWPMTVTAQTRTTSLMNWPMQSHGAEMLRIAMIMATAAGIRICAPVHDAVLIEAPEAEAAAVADRMRSIMVKASEMLIGVPCRVDIKPIKAGERYVDDRGVAMWGRVLHALEKAETGGLQWAA